jgi:hypothetical protein
MKNTLLQFLGWFSFDISLRWRGAYAGLEFLHYEPTSMRTFWYRAHLVKIGVVYFVREKELMQKSAA